MNATNDSINKLTHILDKIATPSETAEPPRVTPPPAGAPSLPRVATPQTVKPSIISQESTPSHKPRQPQFPRRYPSQTTAISTGSAFAATVWTQAPYYTAPTYDIPMAMAVTHHLQVSP
jgi:hypothetical protein